MECAPCQAPRERKFWMTYTIGAFAERTQLSIDTLRYYEKERLIQVGRDASGRRVYTDADVQWIDFIKRLKDTGMPIREIRAYALLRYQGDGTARERLRLLEKHRDFVLAEKAKWDSNLAHLEAKIDAYRRFLEQPAAVPDGEAEECVPGRRRTARKK